MIEGAIRVTGQLIEHARTLYLPQTRQDEPHTAMLEVVINTGTGGIWRAMARCGTSSADYAAAEAKARLMRQGTRCEVYAHGVEPSNHYGQRFLRLLDVSNIIPLGIATPATGETTA